MSTAYADIIREKDPTTARVYECWSLSQLRYMLGDSGRRCGGCACAWWY